MNECVRILDKMPERIPQNGTFELTLRCNLHCKMCLFRHDDSENAALKAKELTAEQWIGMAHEAACAGTLHLLVTGGEPLLRPDFCEIWEGIYRQGFLATLYTNATLVNDRVMDTLRRYPPHKIGITIYGAGPETYEKVTGSAAAFQKTLEGIERLKTLPSFLDYRTTVIRDNLDDLDAMEALVAQLSGGRNMIQSSRSLFPAVRGGCADVQGCRLSPKENVELLVRQNIKKAYAELKADGKNPVGFQISMERNEKPLPSGKYRYSLFGCDAGMRSYTVAYDGKLLACQVMGQFCTDAAGTSFLSAWEALPRAVQLPELCEKCRTCDLSAFCAACPASRYAECGDPGGWAEYICEDAKELKHYSENYIQLRRRSHDEKTV